MISMAMSQDDEIKSGEVNTQRLHVISEIFSISLRVKQYSLTVILDQRR